MRFSDRLIWFGLLVAALGWSLRGSNDPDPQIASPGPLAPKDEPLRNRPDPPRGHASVVAAGALACVAVAFGLAWYAVDQRRERHATALALTRGTPNHAPELMTRYGCGGCHTIPGAPGADGQVGPQLAGLRERVYVGGILRNTPDNLVQWIVDPQRFSPRSAMPATGISEAEARDVAAYLYLH